jgi:putative flavoprotein involved in K+ transport
MMRRPMKKGTLDVLVIGTGQAGLAIGYELRQAGREFLMLDGAPELGHSWRTRWDSLELFTPARFSALRGIPFPGDPEHHPGKDAVATYLAAYARAFELPIGLDEAVRDLRQCSNGGFVATTDHARYRARSVVVATGPFHQPSIPPFASTIAANIVQLHSREYREPTQLRGGPVVVVGGGNSGVQIASELGLTHDVTLAIGTWQPAIPPRLFGRSIFHWLERTGAMKVASTTCIGRWMRGHEHLIGDSPRRIAQTGLFRLAGRAVAANGSGVRTAEGATVPARSIVWATGYRPKYDWLRIPVFGPDRRPLHDRGETAVPGLFFIGLPWQHTRGSALIGWVSRDAAHVAGRIDRHLHAA